MNSIPEPLQQVDETYVRHRGGKLSYFAGCDYHRLSCHPKVVRAATDAVANFGINVSASRMTTGNHALYGKLELALEKFFDAETATLASNGYIPNLMVAQALKGAFSHALVDERAHGCLTDAAAMLDCPVIRFKHRDPADLAAILARLGEVTPLVLTDGMFAYNGSLAPVAEYLGLLPARGMILIDDAHAAGVIGKTGRGSVEFHNLSRKRIIQTITLSKAFGVYGGAVLASRKIRQSILDGSRLFSGNTPLPLPLANAAIASVSLLQNQPAILRKLRENILFVRLGLGLPTASPSDSQNPLLGVYPKDANDAKRLKIQLAKASIHAPFIKYPGGPADGFFRFALSGRHDRKQLQALVNALRNFS